MLPRHFVFATWEGGGTVPPALTAARLLMRRGHRVRILSDACNRAEVEAIGLSGQMHGATLLDASGRVLRPCILWNDGRSAPQCEALTRGWPARHAVTTSVA